MVKEAQADLVRDVARRIVRGESLRGIAATLNARAVPSPINKVWGKTMLRQLVTRERNVGLRVHHGEVVGQGDWPPILDRALWKQARAVLTDPARKASSSSARTPAVRPRPLRDLRWADACQSEPHGPSYRCADKACVSRNRHDLDAFVTAVALERLGRRDVAALLASQDDRTRQAVAEVAELRSRLDKRRTTTPTGRWTASSSTGSLGGCDHGSRRHRRGLASSTARPCWPAWSEPRT